MVGGKWPWDRAPPRAPAPPTPLLCPFFAGASNQVPQPVQASGVSPFNKGDDGFNA